jgi:hypothetical protein
MVPHLLVKNYFPERNLACRYMACKISFFCQLVSLIRGFKNLIFMKNAKLAKSQYFTLFWLIIKGYSYLII